MADPKVKLPEPDTQSLAMSGRSVDYCNGYEKGWESACEATAAQVEAAVLAERERCALVCETHGGPVKWGSENCDRYHIQAEWARVLAAVIRAGGA